MQKQIRPCERPIFSTEPTAMSHGTDSSIHSSQQMHLGGGRVPAMTEISGCGLVGAAGVPGLHCHRYRQKGTLAPFVQSSTCPFQYWKGGMARLVPPFPSTSPCQSVFGPPRPILGA